MHPEQLTHAAQAIRHIQEVEIHGRITSVQGLLLECDGIAAHVSVGARCRVTPRNGDQVTAEVVGISGHIVKLMPFTDIQGIGTGCRVEIISAESSIYPSQNWRGRIINAFAQPVDDKGELPQGDQAYVLRASPPPAQKRRRVEGKMDVGVRAMNLFTTCCKGQRMGIFAGSGVGKSMLMAMLTRFASADIKVIGLIGERGRELKEFIEEYLGEEGLKNAVIVVATSDESALMRRQAAYTTMAVAEYFRNQGQQVLCMMDSITRFAMAQREIGLSAGEPPTSKGYTPTVFVELPKLLERAGPGMGEQGDITGLFTVLVEGDDHNEPISDAVRGIVDGHIVMERKIAERGRFPAINVLKSVSRTMPNCNTDQENHLVTRARTLMSTYDDMQEMIRLGAYRKGSDAQVDEAIFYTDPIEKFLSQKPNEQTGLEECYKQLDTILKMKQK